MQRVIAAMSLVALWALAGCGHGGVSRDAPTRPVPAASAWVPCEEANEYLERTIRGYTDPDFEHYLSRDVDLAPYDRDRGVVIGTATEGNLVHERQPLHVAPFGEAIYEVLDLCIEGNAKFPVARCEEGAHYIESIDCWYALRRAGDRIFVAGVYSDLATGDETIADRRAWLAKIEEVFGPSR